MISVPAAIYAFIKAVIFVGSAMIAADIINNAMEDDEAGEGESCPPDNDYPANPDDWNPPDGWEETNAGEKTGGKHRQWRGPDGQLRRWDREGREGGKERGPHWHDPRHPGKHIPPNR